MGWRRCALILLLTLAACAEKPGTTDVALSAPADAAGEASDPPPPPPPPPPPTLPPPPAALPDPDVAAFPAFPCRPPDASDSTVIATALLVGSRPAPTLGDIETRLRAAFQAAGFPNPRLYRSCGGFVMVAAVERARADGRPFDPPRRFVDPDAAASAVEAFTLAGVLRAVLTVSPGRYRLAAIRVSDQAAVVAAAPAASTVRGWAGGGGLQLPDAIAAQPFTSRHRALALIYELEKRPGEASARLVRPARLPAVRNLELAGLLPALRR